MSTFMYVCNDEMVARINQTRMGDCFSGILNLYVYVEVYQNQPNVSAPHATAAGLLAGLKNHVDNRDKSTKTGRRFNCTTLKSRIMFIRGSNILPIVLASFACWNSLNNVQAFATKGWGPRTTSTSLSASTAIETEGSKVTTAEVLSLDSIRSTLIRQEETIIFAIIERAQFRQNNVVYEKGGFGDLGIPLGSDAEYFAKRKAPLSFLEYMLMGTVSRN